MVDINYTTSLWDDGDHGVELLCMIITDMTHIDQKVQFLNSRQCDQVAILRFINIVGFFVTDIFESLMESSDGILPKSLQCSNAQTVRARKLKLRQKGPPHYQIMNLKLIFNTWFVQKF